MAQTQSRRNVRMIVNHLSPTEHALELLKRSGKLAEYKQWVRQRMLDYHVQTDVKGNLFIYPGGAQESAEQDDEAKISKNKLVIMFKFDFRHQFEEKARMSGGEPVVLPNTLLSSIIETTIDELCNKAVKNTDKFLAELQKQKHAPPFTPVGILSLPPPRKDL